jgi:hypothetical protein
MIKPKATFRQISESLPGLLALCVSLVFGLAEQADPMTPDHATFERARAFLCGTIARSSVIFHDRNQ